MLQTRLFRAKSRHTALDILGPALEKISASHLNFAKADSDLDFIRDDPRFRAMVAAAEARLASAS